MEDKKHLEFMYERLENHGENPRVDYMVRLKKIIDSYVERKGVCKITYSTDYHYRNRDNYPDIDAGEVLEADGNTLEEAIENLRFCLHNDNRLATVIDTEARNLNSYDECRCLNIISIDEVINSSDIEESDIMKHKIFAELISERKKEVEHEKKAREKKILSDEKRKDLAELRRLKKKLGEIT